MTQDADSKAKGSTRRSKVIKILGGVAGLLACIYTTFILTAVTYGADELVRREGVVASCRGQEDDCIKEIRLIAWDRSVFGHSLVFETPRGPRAARCGLRYGIFGALRCRQVPART